MTVIDMSIEAALPAAGATPAIAPGARQPYMFHRHALAVRVTHWINALAIVFLLGTGLNIFNAHPMLYWGQYGSDRDHANRWLEIGAANAAGGELRGYVRIGGLEVGTTGVLGVSKGANGQPQVIAYPAWSTIPSGRDLATARNFHFFFAWMLAINGLVYLAYGVASGHIFKNLVPRLRELSPGNIGHDIVQHLKLKFPKGEDSKRYHILQKLAYAGVVLGLIPLVILSGLGMSPGFDAFAPWVLDLFGGRASSRSLHWVAANLIALFIIVHLLMVLLAGAFNQIRSMITGKVRVDPETAK